MIQIETPDRKVASTPTMVRNGAEPFFHRRASGSPAERSGAMVK